MFETLSGSRRSRPAFAFSVGGHVLLVGLLTVPPLLATQEPPEPEDKMPPFVVTADLLDKSEEKPIFLRKGDGGGSPRAPSHASAIERPPSSEAREKAPRLLPPDALPDFVPAAPDGPPSSPFEERERSEQVPGPGSRLEGGAGPRGGGGGDPNGCDGCPVSADAPDVISPVTLFTPEPHYPETALRARMSGWVTVRAIIETDGSVREVVVIGSSSALFEASAIDAVHRWRYLAGRIGARLVPVSLSVNVRFTLRS